MPGKGELPDKLFENICVPLIAVVFSFLIGAAFVLFVGQNPLFVYARLIEGTLGSTYGLGQVLFKATPLIFTGLSVAFAFRVGLFNIGCEGQLAMGAFATAWAGVTLKSLPGPVLIPISILFGMAFGAFWAFVPGILKARLGTHEVINTIMMNFIASAILSYLVTSVYGVPETLHTEPIALAARIPRLESLWPAFKGSPVNVSFFLALVFCVAVYLYLWHTKFGYSMRATGLSPLAAEYSGVNVRRYLVTGMTLSGALSGLVGVNYVMGYKYYYESEFSGGVGFMAIPVALLGRNHPLGVVLSAMLFGILSHGGLVINTLVPKEFVEILQAVVIVSILITSNIFRDWVVSLRKRKL
ncbi:MAG: ABC transporter permease [Candidatus Eisenbacteria bacterium]|nr:ABC transporter permease [Candidatus Eisenbacteria bacterium]